MVASFKQIEPYIIQSESHGNNYTSQQNYNYPTSTASGYYQITNSTWAGIPTSITGGTQSAYQASFAQQQAAAQWLWDNHNGSDWLCPGCNSTVVNANNAIMAGNTPAASISPMVTQLISTNGGSAPASGSIYDPGGLDYGGGGPGTVGNTPDAPATDSSGDSSGYELPNPLGAGAGDNPPSTSAPYTPGGPATAGGATVPTTANWLTEIGQFFGNWAVRLGLIAVGIVLIGAAAHSLAEEHGGLPALPVGE